MLDNTTIRKAVIPVAGLGTRFFHATLEYANPGDDSLNFFETKRESGNK